MVTTLKTGLSQIIFTIVATMALPGLITNTAVAQADVLSETRQAHSELQAGKPRAAISSLDQAIWFGKMSSRQ